MPTYEFHCSDCGEAFQVVETFDEHDRHDERCPKCASQNIEPVIGDVQLKTARKS